MKIKRPSTKELGNLKAFIKSLAPAKRKKLRELRMKVWWWRRGEIRRAFKNPHEPNRFSFSFDKPAEEVARNYELMRRSEKGETYANNYLDLTRTERTAAYAIWSTHKEPPYRQSFNPSKKPFAPGWIDDPIEWNLFRDDKTLQSAFMKYINQHRQTHRIPSQHPLKGEKFSGVAWRTVEILDCLKCGIISKLNSSQRSAASKGKRQAETFFDNYTNILNSWYDDDFANANNGYTDSTGFDE